MLFTARMKGRLQHALRQSGAPTKFSRKVAFRAIGDNRTNQIETYIASQVRKERFADPRFEERLRKYTFHDRAVDLAQPMPTNSGRYWYNLHLVLVIDGRLQIVEESALRTVFGTCFRIASKKGHSVSSLSVFPDHLHIALRGNIEHSPEEIALAYLNNLAFVLGRQRIWQPGYYVGTFSEYDMQAVRRKSDGD